MKTAIYCRVSTEDQEKEGTSLDSQLDACLAKIEELGYDNSEPYIIQEVWSGLTLDRPKLDLLRDRVMRKEIDTILVHSTDRLSRDPVHLLLLAEEFEKAGATLLFVTEPLDNTIEGQLLGFVKGWASKVEAVKLRERTMRGRKSRAKMGKLPTGGLNLYGYIYDKSTGKRLVNEYEASVIRKMVDWVIRERISLNEVCRRLVSEGIPAPKGGKIWSRSTVGRILSNEVYTGKTYANKMEAVEPKTRKKRGAYSKSARKLRPEAEWILLADDTTPQIITLEEYRSLQKQLDRNRELSPRNQKHQYLLRGYVYCQQCLRKYYGVPVHGKRYYRCSGRSSVAAFGETCSNGLVNADQLESAVWELVVRNIFNPSDWVEASRNNPGEDLELSQWREELDAARDRLKSLDNAENRLIRLYEFTPITEAKFKREHQRIQHLRRQEEEKITTIEESINNYREAQLTEEEIRALAVILRQVLLGAPHGEKNDLDRKRYIFEVIGLKVWINGDAYSCDFRIPSIPARERHIVSAHS